VQTIGLVGGMSWESSAVYYRDLNLGVRQRLGGLSSPRLVLSTVDFAELTDLEETERWDQIGELLAEACLAQGATTVGLIGTKVAMEDDFFAERLGRHGVSVIMPATEHHDWLNSAIYDELVHGRVVDATRRRVVELTEELWDAGARAILLGCTEIETLVSQADVELPVIPCTTLHVNAALDRALS
jgi:aspartate racemase